MSKTQKRTDLHGLLLIDKPSGLSSQQVVTRVKRALNVAKAGHTGTLDPLATGMLPICINHATRFTEFMLSADKAYRVTAKLGETTETGDSEGAVLDSKAIPELNEQQVRSLFKTFLGEQMQTAPKYSALKYNGKPMYYWARKGIEVPLKQRQINITKIEFISFDGVNIHFDATVSKGTYIRSLVESIGEAVGCGAHMTALRRLWVAPFQNAAMIQLDDIDESTPLIGLDTLLDRFPEYALTRDATLDFLHGRSVRSMHREGIYRIYGVDNTFLGLGEVAADVLKSHRVLPTQPLIEQVRGQVSN